MKPGLEPSHLSLRAFVALFVLLFAVAAVPVLRSSVLPLVDYPNHLARMALLARLPGDATLQQFYAPAWRPLPNLAMDIIVPPLLRVMPLAAAGQAFVLLTFLLLAGGAALIHRALFGRWSAWPCLGFLLLYGRLLMWGQLNYLFGLGLGLCAFAAWIALGPRAPALRLGVGAAAALAVYFAHLMAFGVYAVLLLGYEAGPLLRARSGTAARRLMVAALPLLLPLVVMTLGPAGGSGAVLFDRPWRKLDLLFSVFDLYHRPFDIACFALAVIALGVAYWRRWLVLSPSMRLPLMLLGLAYLVMPSQLMGASGVDRRLPLALALALVGSSAWIAPQPRRELWLLAAAGVLFAVRLGTVAASWQASDREYRVLLAGLDLVPPGSRIAVAFPPAAANASATPLVHLPVLAAARRDAFVPTLFAQPTQQPIVLTPRFAALAAATAPDRLWAAFVGGTTLDDADRAAFGQYDELVLVGVAPFTPAGVSGLAPVFAAPRLKLYRLAARSPD